MTFPKGEYQVILADPPWQYDNYAAPPGETHDRARGAQKHYPTMKTEDICALPVHGACAEQTALFMWATWPLIKDAFVVMEAWGFTYKTLAWEWIKLNPSSIGVYVGMGNYTRSNPEPCLLAFNGEPLKVQDHAVSSVMMCPIMEHSRKPEAQYHRIQRLYPQASKLELFARRETEGWDVWGNEV